MNAKLIETMQRHNAEIAALVRRNEEVLRQCSEFLTQGRTDGNGSARLEQVNG